MPIYDFGTNQSASDAQANLTRLQTRRIEQLRKKAAAGTLTAAQAEELRRLTGEIPSDFYTADDPLDAGWDTFQEEAQNNFENIPGSVAAGGSAVKDWLTEKVQAAADAAGKPFSEAWAKTKKTVLIWTVCLVGLGVALWYFTRKKKRS